MASSSKRQLRVLLVDGYIREHEKKLSLSNIIPKSINSIIFEFQLLIEKWSKKWSHPKANIIDDGSTFEGERDEIYSFYFSAFGDHIVKYGDNFVWNIEITKGGDGFLGLGLIPNNEGILTKCQGDYAIHQKGGYLWSVNTGYFGYDGQIRKVFDRLWSLQKGDMFTVKFNWKESSLHCFANGKDLGNAFDAKDCNGITTDENAEFRFAVTLSTSQGNCIGIKIDSEPNSVDVKH